MVAQQELVQLTAEMELLQTPRQDRHPQIQEAAEVVVVLAAQVLVVLAAQEDLE